ncbi:MAG TPA: four helix bundle protein [Bacteroidales bacterium]|jgi:four helix bundle protein|nr:four helix bundle protein [Bacteroidales bacterium]
MKFDRFEDIIAWQKAKEMALHVYSAFKNNNDYGFKDQIFRSSVSVMNNIAEGYERKSNQDFQRFLFIAKGSCGEVRSMIQLAYELNYISVQEYDSLWKLSFEISKILSGLIKALN